MDSTIYLMVALMPLVASMLIFQVNPYHALVIRGILGAVSAMIYAVLGAPDVALTEALVGTLLAITLYAIAVRSSLVMRVGVLEQQQEEGEGEGDRHFKQLLSDLRSIFKKRHMHLELISYSNPDHLKQGLLDREIHATCVQGESLDKTTPDGQPLYQTSTRIPRIYDILQSELKSPVTELFYIPSPVMSSTNSGEKHS